MVNKPYNYTHSKKGVPDTQREVTIDFNQPLSLFGLTPTPELTTQKFCLLPHNNVHTFVIGTQKETSLSFSCFLGLLKK